MNADQFRAAFDSLPALTIRNRWDKHRRSLRRHVGKNDPAQLLNWSTITATMFVGNAPYIDHEMEALQRSPNWPRWRQAIVEPGFGNPAMYPGNWTSGNLIHQAYHLKQWLDKSSKDISELAHIAEVGGGYGAMALVARRMGFKGQYFILDLPEFLLLQEFYLSNVGIDGVEFCGTLAGHFDLLIGICSLSEMSIDARSAVLGAVTAEEYLIVHQNAWEKINNKVYFAQFMMSKSSRAWSTYYNPCYKNHWYCVGVE